MQVLIVEPNQTLTEDWRSRIAVFAEKVFLATDQAEAVDVLRHHDIQVIVLDLILGNGSALAVADFASYRRPDARVVFVTGARVFSDGSIFNHSPNACAFLPKATPPDDLAMMVEYHGRAS
ncbi:ActR/RegA family two-component response regulator [Rhodobacteraceae bacterium MBR-64]|jgi:ActR/RegA family two-component response regulator